MRGSKKIVDTFEMRFDAHWLAARWEGSPRPVPIVYPDPAESGAIPSHFWALGQHKQIMLPRIMLPTAVVMAVIPTPQLDLGPGGCTSTTLRVCSGHGRCHEGMCFCDRGFSGSACERRDYLFACPSNCSFPDGICMHGRCICAPSHSGDDCADVTHGSCSSNCSGHGVCVDGQCSCRAGFYGHTCAQGCPGYVFDTADVCSGRGLCVPTGSPGHSPDRCACAT